MKRIRRLAVVFGVVAALAVTTAVPAFATAPDIERGGVEYLGSGKVEVEFLQDIKYKNAKVTVKDKNSGKKYSASIYHKDSDDLKFKIRNYKKGKTYKFTISGVKVWNTSKFGKVTGKVSVPKASSGVTEAQAKKIAVNDTVSVFGIDAGTVKFIKCHKDYDDGRYEWEIEFTANKPNDTVLYEYEYTIVAKNGKIAERDCDVFGD